jgi:hypothetical protein
MFIINFIAASILSKIFLQAAKRKGKKMKEIRSKKELACRHACLSTHEKKLIVIIIIH